MWVCGECDSLWLGDRRVGKGVSLGDPSVVLDEIQAPPDDNLYMYVDRYGGPGTPTDWQQLRPIGDSA